MAYLAAFLEGIVTFVSPCLLPLLPVYLAYFAGDAQGVAQGRGVWRTLAGALCFVLGFSVPFTAAGAVAGLAGSLLLRWRAVLDAACGLLVVVLGLDYLGVLHIGALQRTVRLSSGRTREGLLGPFLLGVTFAVGWSPCVGTFLASALGLAAQAASAARGVAMLACFSAGLGVPFVLSALLVTQLEGAFVWVKGHYELVNRICGLLLVVVGVLMATGRLGTWMALLAA